MRRGRLLWAGVATAAFTIPLIWTLLSPGAPDRQSTPIEPKVPAEPLSISFSRISPWGDERIHEMSLFSPVPVDILRHAEIHITFYQSDKASRHPATGRLEVVGTPCIYEMQPGAEINNGIPQPFVRTGRCLPSDGRPTGELWLTVKMGGPGALGLFTLPLAPADRSGGMIYIGERREGIPDPPPTIMGVFIDDHPDRGLSRANLLAYVWTGSTRSGGIWWAVGAIALLVFAGTATFPLTAAVPFGRQGHLTFVTATVAAAFCLATAVAAAYALTIPPLQAADETHHLAGYATLTGRPALIDDAINWARTNHVYRIRGAANRQFRSRDVGRPYPDAPSFEVAPTGARSSLTAGFWTLTSRWLPNQSVARLFLAMRLVNAVLFGAAVAVSAGLLANLTGAPYAQLICLSFLFAPAVPSFAMTFSEASLLTSVYTLLAAGVVVVALGDTRAHWVGLPLGLASAALLGGARSSLPMVPMVITSLAIRVLVGSGRGAHSLRSAGVFWTGFAAGATALGVALWNPDFQQYVALVATHPSAARLSALVGLTPEQTAGFVGTAMSWSTLVWLIPAACIAGWGLEAGLKPLGAAVALRGRPLFLPAARTLLGVAALAVAASFIASLAIRLPDVQNIESPIVPSLGSHAWDVVSTAASMFRLTAHSTFMANAFWIGFGSLDTMPGPLYTTLLVLVTGIMVMALSIHTATTGNLRRFAALGVAVAGLLLTIAAYGVTAYALKANLHGRYLIGWFLVLLAITWIAPAVVASPSPAIRPVRWRALVLLVMCGGFHAYALSFVLRRFF